ncbi:hypothetical protein ACWG0P_10885 [Amedibacillus sp. YH-ame6]
MSYQDALDRKECIRRAKKELGEFSDLIKLQGQNYVVSSTSFEEMMKTISYLNYDHRMIRMINDNDEKNQHIANIYKAINKLSKEEANILYLLYVKNHRRTELDKILLISRSSLQRKLNNAYFNFSIALGIEVMYESRELKKEE